MENKFNVEINIIYNWFNNYLIIYINNYLIFTY
jgi:hypothetical protein